MTFVMTSNKCHKVEKYNQNDFQNPKTCPCFDFIAKDFKIEVKNECLIHDGSFKLQYKNNLKTWIIVLIEICLTQNFQY